jgi:hypothetical protein
MSTHQNALTEMESKWKLLKMQKAIEHVSLVDSGDKSVLSIYYTESQKTAGSGEGPAILDGQGGCATAPLKVETKP